MLEPKVFTVTQINRYIKNLMENDFVLNSMWIKGEISNFKFHSSGHMYFTLKDQNSAINCVMFKGSAMILPFMPQNGMSVVICGYISLYEKTGQYQLYAELMDPVGVGALYEAFEQLKEKLSNEGLFDEDYKRDICAFPKEIAVITSPTGAAVRDIIQISKRRNKSVKITVVPILVQGENAADTIVSALKLVNEHGHADTVILGRGGGSIEDLWAFNEEKVARAIFASEIPVISAVGHETDFTIADFVADLRAPTPSAAAELAVNNAEGMVQDIKEFFRRINILINGKIEFEKNRLSVLENRPVLKRPLDRINDSQIYVEKLEKSLNKEIKYKIEKNITRFINVVDRLEGLSPLAVLKRGYCVAKEQNGSIIKSVDDIDIDEIINIRLEDGSLDAVVCGKVKIHG